MTLEEMLAHARGLPLVQEALRRLREGLPPSLLYHSARHTEDVLEQVLLFALTDGLTLRECELLAIAAAYHDIGFLVRVSENEVLGAATAEEAMLKEGGFSSGELAEVKTAILDTQVRITAGGPRQVSTSKLSNYLLDADVSNLGRDDFFDKAELVRKENGVTDQATFLKGLRVFLDAHRWYSPAGQRLRAQGKRKNVKLLTKKFA